MNAILFSATLLKDEAGILSSELQKQFDTICEQTDFGVWLNNPEAINLLPPPSVTILKDEGARSKVPKTPTRNEEAAQNRETTAGEVSIRKRVHVYTPTAMFMILLLTYD